MKKFLSVLVTILILSSMLASCSKSKNDDKKEPSGGGGDQNASVSGDSLWQAADIINVLAVKGASPDVVNKLYDAISPLVDSAPILRPLDSAVGKTELLIGDTGREISDRAYEKLERMEKLEQYDARWLIYCEGKTVAIAYDDDDEDVALTYAAEYFIENCVANDGVIVKIGVVAQKLFNLKDHYQAIDDAETAKKWAVLEEATSTELVNALKELYGMYSDDMILWLADLYDPAVGGFYYSNSARDTEGYLPDVDSTYQVLALLSGSGAFTSNDQLPEHIQNQIVTWVKGLQHSNGYFYHPQWGVSLTDLQDSRRSRDLSRAISVLSWFGAKPTYDTPTGTKGDGILADGTPVAFSGLTEPLTSSVVTAVSKIIAAESSSVAVPSHLKDKESFEAWLADKDINKDSYSIGSGIVAQISEIKYRDKVLKEGGADYSICDILINWFNEHQYENGLWEERVTENSVNGLMKIAGCYSNIGTPIPRAELGAAAAMDYILNGEVNGGIVGVFNPWSALSRIQGSMENDSDPEIIESAQRIRALVTEYAVDGIKATAKKLADFAKLDGSYSYTKSGSASTSQGVPIAVPGSNEGDVNAALLGSNDVVNSIYNALGISDHFVPFYTYTDMKVFGWRICELEPVIKDDNIVGEVATVTFDDDAADMAPSSVDYSLSSTSGYMKIIEDPREDRNGNVLYLTSSSGGKDLITIPASNLTSSPSRYVFEADFCIDYLSGYSVQIFLSNSYMITFQAKNGKVDVVEASSNTASLAKTQALKITPNYGEWFNLRVEYYVGDHDTVRIKVYFNDKLMAVTDNYYDKSGGKLTAPGDPAVGYSIVTIQTLSSAGARMMMDNIEVYGDSERYVAITDPALSPAINVDKEARPIDTDTEMVYTFASPEYNGILHDFLGNSSATPGSAKIEDDALKLTSPDGKDGFAVKGGSGVDEYVIGTTYYFETDFTYHGGTQVNPKDKNAAFVGLLANDDELKNSKMFAWGYLSFVDGGEAISLYGAKLEKGVTYRLRIEYTVGEGDYDPNSTSSKSEYVASCFRFYVDGKLVDTADEITIGLATPGSDRTFLGFGIYTRGDSNLVDNLEFSMDNIYIGSKAPSDGDDELPDADFDFIDQPSYDGLIPDGWTDDN